MKYDMLNVSTEFFFTQNTEDIIRTSELATTGEDL